MSSAAGYPEAKKTKRKSRSPRSKSPARVSQERDKVRTKIKKKKTATTQGLYLPDAMQDGYADDAHHVRKFISNSKKEEASR